MTGEHNGGAPPQRASFGGNIRAVLNVTGLSRTAKLILLCIAAYANEDGEDSRPAYSTMAKAGCCSRRYAILTAQQLIDAGLITLTRPGRRGRGLEAPNTFAINVQKLLERQQSRGDLQSSPLRPPRGDLQSSPLQIPRGDLQSSLLQNCKGDLARSPENSAEVIFSTLRGDLQRSPDPRVQDQVQEIRTAAHAPPPSEPATAKTSTQPTLGPMLLENAEAKVNGHNGHGPNGHAHDPTAVARAQVIRVVTRLVHTVLDRYGGQQPDYVSVKEDVKCELAKLHFRNLDPDIVGAALDSALVQRTRRVARRAH